MRNGAGLRILLAPRLLEALMPTAALVVRSKHAIVWGAVLGFLLACLIWPQFGRTVLNILKIALLYAANTRG